MIASHDSGTQIAVKTKAHINLNIQNYNEELPLLHINDICYKNLITYSLFLFDLPATDPDANPRAPVRQ